MQCEICGQEIPAERLEILPETTRCVQHSEEEKNIGFMDFPHKTGSELVRLDPTKTEDRRLAERYSRRER